MSSHAYEGSSSGRGAVRMVRFEVTFRMRGPTLSNASGSRRFGVDTTFEKDLLGRPALPGSLIKGNVAHAWEVLYDDHEHKELCRLLLGATSDSENCEPSPALLTFSSYWSDTKWTNNARPAYKYRIARDEDTGTVCEGSLQVIESPYATGEEVDFVGEIIGRLPVEKISRVNTMLEKGFRFVPALGALKGVGFGRIVDVTITQKTFPRSSSVSGENICPSAHQVGVRLCTDRPFCFARPDVGTRKNHFTSTSYIPGGALVAAFMRAADTRPEEYPTLLRYIDALCVTNALPVPSGSSRRAVPIPLSCVSVTSHTTTTYGSSKKKTFYDVARLKEWDEHSAKGVPTFQVDWKDKDNTREEACALYGHYDGPVVRTLSVRTAIDPKSGTARDGQLFSMECVGSPMDSTCEWLANISLHAVEDDDERGKVISELASLLRVPLTHLGKTKACATGTLENAFPHLVDCDDYYDNDVVRVYLCSPARLLTATCAAQSEHELEAAYARAWTQLSHESLQMENFFAAQTLYGGAYWWHRFRQKRAPYRPEIFTLPGSVFTLRKVATKQEVANHTIREWLQRGLPQLSCAPGGEDWRENPWIRANGYGEIAVNIMPKEVELL